MPPTAYTRWSSLSFLLALIMLITVAFVNAAENNGFHSYGDPKDDYPNWQERATLVYTNMARMNPIGYNNAFNPAATYVVSSVPPLFEHFDLDRAGRFHANDMATNGCFSHESCDGTNTFVRIKRFYTESGSLAENIASGHQSPSIVVRAWMNSAGHRTNIMNGNYRVMGNGFVKFRWVQNFGGGITNTSNAIAAAAHDFVNNGNTTFFANFYQTTTTEGPSSAVVSINGTDYEMKLTSNFAMSTRTKQGTFVFETTRATSWCQEYYFKFTDSKGVAHRYPTHGSFYTLGETPMCTLNYQPPQWQIRHRCHLYFC